MVLIRRVGFGGWRIELVLLLCVEYVWDLENTVRYATGVTCFSGYEEFGTATKGML